MQPMEFHDTPMPVLETDRLVIRRFVAGDLPDFHRALLGDPDWWDACSIAEAKGKMEYYIRQTEFSNPPLGYQGVFLRERRTLIGTVGYESYFLGPGEQRLFSEEAIRDEDLFRTLEYGVGYFISAEFRGRGYASEAVKALIEYAFQVIKVRRIWAETWHENTASIKLMEKVGMKIGRNPDPDVWPGVWGVVENRIRP